MNGRESKSGGTAALLGVPAGRCNFIISDGTALNAALRLTFKLRSNSSKTGERITVQQNKLSNGCYLLLCAA